MLLSLTNPLNITLITSQLLSAPSLWDPTSDLSASQRVFSVFYTAALQLSKQSASESRPVYKPVSSLGRAEWATAVVNGADDKSPRWRHTLVLGAILLGFEEKQKQSLPFYLRNRLASALVTATSLALQDTGKKDVIGDFTIAFVLSNTFELLSDYHRLQLNYDIILPVLLEAAFLSKEGLQHGYWLGAVDQDVIEVTDRKFNWSAASDTYRLIRHMQDRPFVASLGPMSRLISHSVENVRDSSLLLLVIDQIAEFARILSISWRQNKLSEIDASEELDFLDDEAIRTTLPTLWHMLRLSLFAVVIILRAVIGRLLSDAIIASEDKAPFLAMQCLHTLRNLYFVSSRLGQTSSSQYVFVNMVAMDILTHFPEQAEQFIRSIKPAEQGQVPAHPADRCLDLFFLNTAEHFTLTLNPKLNEEVLLAGAMPYLVAGNSTGLREIFEAAHSLALCVLAAPQNAKVAARHLPFYVDALFKCFPNNLSSRQFRLAFKTIIRISSPPSPLAQSQPMLPSILLETTLELAKEAPTITLPAAAIGSQSTIQETPLSKQAVLIMAMIDSLRFLHPALLEEWLSLIASVVVQIEDTEMRIACQNRFWEAMSSGEMDVERAALCVCWWGSRGGREQILHSDKGLEIDHVMSGALSIESKL